MDKSKAVDKPLRMTENLPSIANAKLPPVYLAAKAALAECSRIDECLEWADKAQAMASYAKQAADDTLRNTAMRIQGRAISRCGELLAEIKKTQGGRPEKTKGGAPPSFTRAQAARDAGLSDDQRKTALRVANVPRDVFESLVESERPPTVTQLAELGTKSKPTPIVDLDGRDPAEFQISTVGQGQIRRLAEFTEQHKPAVIARGALPHEYANMKRDALRNVKWLTALQIEIDRCKED